MKKLQSTLPNMILSLGVITIVAASLLAWTHSVTQEPIEAAARQKQTDAIKAVAPKFDNDPSADAWEYTPEGATEAFVVYPAMLDGKLNGAAVKGYTNTGFSGYVQVMYGFAADGTITGYEVLSHAETPGLGAKMNEWFRMEAGNRSVIGKNPETTPMYVSKDVAGGIDAITAATISSRAFLNALRDSFDAYKAYSAQLSNTNNTADKDE